MPDLVSDASAAWGREMVAVNLHRGCLRARVRLHRTHEAPGHGQAEPTPASALLSPRRETARRCGRDAGPAPRTQSITRRSNGPRTHRLPGARVVRRRSSGDALADEIGEGPFQEGGVGQHLRQRLGRAWTSRRSRAAEPEMAHHQREMAQGLGRQNRQGHNFVHGSVECYGPSRGRSRFVVSPAMSSESIALPLPCLAFLLQLDWMME